ncbi:MAG: dihydrolipoyl dehydrogenase [Planctomycetaceae bacterium]|nr:dihydrolipoyl dehydrogenase [Planctomycetaceae bacterium]
MADKHAQLVVLGGGPGGYPAAFAAADHGMKVILVDEGTKPGGVCLNRGCIPSKALLHVAKLINESRESAEWGVTFQPPVIDLNKLRDFKNHVIGSLSGGIEGLCKARNVELLKGRGTLTGSGSMQVAVADGTSQNLTFDHCIVATGSTPAMPPIFNIGDDRVMDSTGALELKDVPTRLLVIGGGYIGLEMGSVYAALGSDVTVVEMTPGLLPGADRDLVTPLQKRLASQFAAIHLNTKVASLTAADAGITASLEGAGVPSELTFDRVLISIGRRPNSRNCGLENTQVQFDDRGFIRIDRNQRTDDPNLLAIGDVAGEPMLAHKATREAKVAVESLIGEPAEFDNLAIPAVVFTDPELAWCGLTETEAKSRGVEFTSHRFPWAASGRAQTLARTEGVTKLIVDPATQRVLGIGIVGPGAGEMIAEAVIAIEMGATARDLADSIHAHPTLSETLMEAAESVIGQPTHFHRPTRKTKS